MGGDFFTGAVLATALTKLVLRFDEKAKDRVAANALRAEVVRLLDSRCLSDGGGSSVGNVDYDFCHPSRAIQVCICSD